MVDKLIKYRVRWVFICCALLFTGCVNTSLPITTTVKNMSEHEIWVDEFKIGDKRLPVGVLLPYYPASHLFYSHSIAKTAYFKWVTHDGVQFEEIVEIERPLPSRKVGDEYHIFFEINHGVNVLVKTKRK